MSAGPGDSATSELGAFRRDYAFAFLTYRLEGTESRLLAAYELGRRAMANGMSLWDLSKVHHEVVTEALLAARDEAALHDVIGAASAFFVEVLSTFEMVRRGFTEIRRASAEDRG